MFFEFPTVREDLDRLVSSGNRLVQFDLVYYFHRNRVRPADTVLCFRPLPNGKPPDTLETAAALGIASPLEIAMPYDELKGLLIETGVARDYAFLETPTTKFAIRSSVVRMAYVEGDKTCFEFADVARRLTIPDVGIYECARATFLPPHRGRVPNQG